MISLNINRGETLAIICTPKTDGTPIVLDETYQVAAFLAPKNDATEGIDLGAVVADGKVAISFDTVDVPRGYYKVDIRITNATPTDCWTEKFEVIVAEPVTKPSTRA